MTDELLENVLLLHALNLKKYEDACMWRQHADAIRHGGQVEALEHLLLIKGKMDIVNERNYQMEQRRNKVLELYRELKKNG